MSSPRKIASVPLPWWTSKSTIAMRVETELGLRVAGGDRDVAEKAEAERLVRERVVAGRPDEREPAAVDCLQADADGQLSGLPARLGCERAGLEPHRPVDRGQPREVLRGVHALQLLPCGRRGRRARRSAPPAARLARDARRWGAARRAGGSSGARRCLQRASRSAERPRPHSDASSAPRPQVGGSSGTSGQRSGRVHRGDAAVEPERLGLALEAPCRERVLEAGVAAEEIGGRLRADARARRESGRTGRRAAR